MDFFYRHIVGFLKKIHSVSVFSWCIRPLMFKVMFKMIYHICYCFLCVALTLFLFCFILFSTLFRTSLVLIEHFVKFHFVSSLCLLNILFYFINLFIYLYFSFGCVGSSLQRAGATLHRGARASHCCGLSRCGAWAPGVWASAAVACGL